jgi:hypothetical protein
MPTDTFGLRMQPLQDSAQAETRGSLHVLFVRHQQASSEAAISLPLQLR